MPLPELFDNTFCAWLEANGVTFADGTGSFETPFTCTIDPNTLKIGIGELINVYTTHEVDHQSTFSEDCMLCHRELAVIDALN